MDEHSGLSTGMVLIEDNFNVPEKLPKQITFFLPLAAPSSHKSMLESDGQ